MRAALLVALMACTSGTAAVPPPQPGDAGPAVVIPPDAGPPSRLALMLDAFAAEPDPQRRVDLAVELAREDLIAAGLQDRVLALVRAYVLIPDGDWTASSLLASLIHDDAPPPEPVGDLALALAGTGGHHTKFMAFHLLRKMADRRPEVCALMADLATTRELPRAVDTIAHARDACLPHLDPVIAALARAGARDEYQIEHYLALRVLLQQTPLTEDQLTILAAAARKARRTAGRHLDQYANDLVRRIERLR